MLLFKVTKQLCWVVSEEKELIHSHILHQYIYCFRNDREAAHWEANNSLCSASDLVTMWVVLEPLKHLSFHFSSLGAKQSGIIYSFSFFFSLHMHLGSELCEGDIATGILQLHFKALTADMLCLLVPYISCPSSSPEGKLQEGGTFIFHHWFVNFGILVSPVPRTIFSI